MNKISIIAKREYSRTIRKPIFWISTLFFPIFIVIVSLISGFSSSAVAQSLKDSANSAKGVLILDKSGLIHQDKLPPTFKMVSSEEEGIDKVKQNDADVFIYYPPDFATSLTINIYQQDPGLLLQGRFNQAAIELVKSSILSEVNDQQKIKIFNSTFNPNVTSYKDGEVVNEDYSKLIIPGISLALYFILTTFATSYLLLSVAEEKENRVMEIVLSSVKPKELILGKMIGLIGIIITQVLILSILSVVGIYLVSNVFASLFAGQTSTFSSGANFNIQLGALNLTTGQLLLQILSSIFYTFTGFLFLASVMVGVGAAAPTYKEAQNLSAIFIIISILPIYFISLIAAEPSGSIAKIFSYIPFTASFVLLFRNAMGALSLQEFILTTILLIIYCYIAVILAFKLFEFGALEYSRKISLRDFLASIRKKSNSVARN